MSTNRYDGHDLDVIAALLATSSTARHVYVAPSGSDNNEGTVAAPKQTLMGAFALCPPMLTAPFVVHLASGDYTWSSLPPKVWQRDASAFMVVVGDGAGQANDDGMTVVATGTVSATSTPGVIQTTGLSAAALIGCTLEVLTGQSAGQRRGIVDNSETTIRLVHPTYISSYGALAVGDTFRVVRPAAKIMIGPYRSWNPAGQLIHAVNFQTNGLRVEPCGAPMMAFGIETGGINIKPLVHFSIGAAADGPQMLELLAAIAPQITSTSTWQGWGWQNPVARGSIILAGPSQFMGFLCTLSGTLATSHRNINAYVNGARIARIAGSAGMVVFEYPAETPPMICASQAQDGVHIEGSMSVDFVNVVDVEISAPTYGYLARLCHQNNLIFRQAVRVKIKTGVTNCTLIEVHGQSRLMNWAGTESPTLIVTFEAVPTHFGLLYCTGSGQVDWQGTVSAEQTGHAGTLITDNARCRFDALNLTGTTSANAICLYGGGRLELGRYATNVLTSTITSACAGGGAIRIDTGSELVLHERSQLNVTNLATSAGSDGVRCWGRFEAYYAPAISTNGVSGYGLNCRGGGRAIFSAQPTAIVGPTADMTVGTGVGDDFADTALSAAFSFKQAGMSIIQRRA